MRENIVEIPSDVWGKSFLFSVIMPVYQTEKYVRESIRCVLDQSIGFAQNIQLILVNNATMDNAGEICKEYVQRYPHNIVYVELPENRGPSGARNAALPYVRGKYVNFLDSDDKWDKNAFKHVKDFFEKHKEIKCVTCRKKYFDAWKTWLDGDYMFSKSRVCNIHSEPTSIQFWLGSIFLDASLISEVSFDEKSRYCEDMKFINEILLNTEKFGILKEAVFLYRRRSDDGAPSQVQVQRTERYWYFDAFTNSYLYLAELSKQKYGEVIPYVQYVLMQEICWRIKQQELPEDFTEEERSQYKGMLKSILLHIEDYIILSQRNMWKEHKVFCLHIKYGASIYDEIELRKKEFVFRNIRLFWRDEKEIVKFLGHKISNNKICIEMQINIPLPTSEYEFFVMDSTGKKYSAQKVWKNRNDNIVILEEDFVGKYHHTFEVDVPTEEQRIFAMFSYRGIEYSCKMHYAPQNRFCAKVKNRFCADQGLVLVPKEGNLIVIPDYGGSASKEWESKVRKELRKAKHKRGLLYRILKGRLSSGEKNWILYLDKTPDEPEMEQELRRVAIEKVLLEKPADMPLRVVCPESELEWVCRYGKPISTSGWDWVKTAFSAEALLSFDPNKAEVFGWHTDLVKDLLTYSRINLNDYINIDKICKE